MSSNKGSDNGNAKLTEKNVKDIRNNIDVKDSQLANIYGVDTSTISRIQNRKIWKHVA